MQETDVLGYDKKAMLIQRCRETVYILNVKILAVINATYAVAKRMPEKIRLA